MMTSFSYSQIRGQQNMTSLRTSDYRHSSIFPLAGRSAREAFVTLSALAARFQIVAEEFSNQLRNLVTVRLQGEVPGIEQMHLYKA
ncbi:MAG: hypothetical protein JW395_2216 [Nitrospira sp.]|nr:hypothetical protein [Nitrospira sp.]